MTEPGRSLVWKVLERRREGDFKVFSVRKDVCESPRTGSAHDFYVLEGMNWVNVVAITRDGLAVLIRQFRHGSSEVTLEIPGGCVDPSDPSPLAAAQRELMEETGYAAEEWIELGYVNPNPAIQANLCYTFLARNAWKAGETQFDGTEDIEVELRPLRELPELVLSGATRHALVIVAFHLFSLFQARSDQPEMGGSAL